MLGSELTPFSTLFIWQTAALKSARPNPDHFCLWVPSLGMLVGERGGEEGVEAGRKEGWGDG